jgi:DNA-binding transcriptional ArsR family regulator
VLQIETPKELDFHPGGAGLTLMPTADVDRAGHGRGRPGRPGDDRLPGGDPAPPLVDQVTGDPLAGLLGYTRAAVLRLALTERTTTELASELGVSAATVSGHTKALRAAGLIATARAGKAVLHTVTQLGGKLLDGAPGQPARRAQGRHRDPPVSRAGRPAGWSRRPDRRRRSRCHR